MKIATFGLSDPLLLGVNVTQKNNLRYRVILEESFY